MSFTGEELLEYARSLYDEVMGSKDNLGGMQQAALRTILSRAYYSAFLETRSYLNMESDQSGSVHGKVQSEIQKKNRTMGNHISDLKRLRTKADYRRAAAFTPSHARRSLSMAKAVIDGLKKLRAE